MSVDPSDEWSGSVGIQPFCALPSLFSHIPPERIGLNGEYDYYGLSNRVRAALTEAFSAEAICNLKVRQRGAMIVLLGHVTNRSLLARIVQVAASVEGAVGVELNGVSIVPPSTERHWEEPIVWQVSHP